jgi:hypothetical protein
MNHQAPERQHIQQAAARLCIQLQSPTLVYQVEQRCFAGKGVIRAAQELLVLSIFPCMTDGHQSFQVD